MTRRDHTFAIALLLSVALHAATVLFLLGRFDGRWAGREGRRAPRVVAGTVDQPAFQFVFGDRRGEGDASNSRPGEQPLISREGARQAFLSRDPMGAGRAGEEPSMSVLPRAAASPPAPPAAPLPPRAMGVGARSPAPAPRVRRAAPAPPRAAQSNAPAADPAIMSDSESDPFSRSDAAVMFRDGRMDVRLGRKVKTVRPRLSIAAEIDLFSMQFPRMVVRLSVDAAGQVRRVDIVRSTGSASADQEVKVALYQWWVEPARSPTGVATADTIEFPITWR